MSKDISEMSRDEIMSSLRHHRSEYEKLSLAWKKIQREEELALYRKKQAERLEECKARYGYFVGFNDGALTPINWEEVSKLLSLSSPEEGYCLTIDEHGNVGLGVLDGSGNIGFRAMVEDELEAKRFDEREARIAIFKKGKK